MSAVSRETKLSPSGGFDDRAPSAASRPASSLGEARPRPETPPGSLAGPGGADHLLIPRRRWNWMRKRDAVVALRAGIIKLDEFHAKAEVPLAEIAEWMARYEWGGDDALREAAPGLRRARAA